MNVISLFSGAGGEALGLEGAGFEHLSLCEWDPDACATLRAAGLGPVVEGDVRDLDAIEAVAGPSCDLLWSSFPCQAFSTAGKGLGAADPRNGWPWTVDAIDHFKPTWFLGENVRGLLMHREGCTARGGQLGIFGTAPPEACRGCYFERRILPDLSERFEHVGWWLLDAASFGVPQHRRRVILWAGPAPVVEPVPTHGPGRALPWVSMGDAFGWGKVAREGWPGPGPTVTTTEVKGTRGEHMHKALASGGKSGGPDRASDALWLATGRRRLGIDECATLQDFPPDHPWQGTAEAQYRQVGNACPPTLARVVGEAVMRAARQA
jgi:DNA (cytosine-5)-methyltransferase 1